MFAGRFGIVATAWGAVAGPSPMLGIRAIGTTRNSFRIRPGFAVQTAAFGEFLRLMFPRMFSVAIEPLTITYFTRVASGLGVGAVSSLNFALDYQVLPVSLIGVAFSLAVFPVLSTAFADDDGPGFREVLRRNIVTIAILTTISALAIFILAGPLWRCCSAVDGSTPMTSPGPCRSWPRSRVDPVRRAVLSALARAVRDARHAPPGRRLVRRAGGRNPRDVRARGPLGLLAIPLGYATGMIVKDILLAVFLATRVRRIGLSSPA